MIERLAREEMISANTIEHDLMNDVGMKSICEDLAEEALMRLRTSAYVTMEKDNLMYNGMYNGRVSRKYQSVN